MPLPPITLADLAPGRSNVAQIIMEGGRAQAEAALHGGDAWANGIGSAVHSLTGGLQEFTAANENQDAQNAVRLATSRQYPSATLPAPGSAADVPDSGENHLDAILSRISPEKRPQVQAAITAVQESRDKVVESRQKIQEAQNKLDLDARDHWYTFAKGFEQHLADPDGGIGAASVGMGLSQGVPGAEQFAPLAQKYAQDYMQAPDEASKAQVVDSWKQQVTPLVQRGVAGGSLEAQKNWAEIQDKLEGKTREVTITNPDGSKTVKIVKDEPGQTFAGAPQPPKPGSEEAFIVGRYGRNPTPEQALKGRAEYAAAGRNPADDAAPTLTGSALDMTANLYAQTGTLPPMGMGRAGATVRQAIINRAAELHPDANIAENKAAYGADTGSLKKLQQQTDAVSAFESTASANAKILDDVLKRTPDIGVKFLNKPLRAIEGQLGSEDVAAFNTIRQSVQNEYARIISNPNLSGTMSDSARKEAETLLSTDATVGQIRAALKVLKTEAANRHTSYQDQIDSIRRRMGGQGGVPAGGGTDVTAPDGKTYHFATAAQADIFKKRAGIK